MQAAMYSTLTMGTLSFQALRTRCVLVRTDWYEATSTSHLRSTRPGSARAAPAPRPGADGPAMEHGLDTGAVGLELGHEVAPAVAVALAGGGDRPPLPG